MTSRTTLTFHNQTNKTPKIYESYETTTNENHYHYTANEKQTYESLMRLEMMETHIKALEEKLTSFAQQLKQLEIYD